MVVRAAAVAISSSVSTPLARPDPAPTRFFNRLTAVAALVGGRRDGSADGARRGGRGVRMEHQELACHRLCGEIVVVLLYHNLRREERATAPLAHQLHLGKVPAAERLALLVQLPKVAPRAQLLRPRAIG